MRANRWRVAVRFVDCLSRLLLKSPSGGITTGSLRLGKLATLTLNVAFRRRTGYFSKQRAARQIDSLNMLDMPLAPKLVSSCLISGTSRATKQI